MSARAKGPHADELRRDQIVTWHACGHDTLDELGVPRFADGLAYTLAERIGLLAARTEGSGRCVWNAVMDAVGPFDQEPTRPMLADAAANALARHLRPAPVLPSADSSAANPGGAEREACKPKHRGGGLKDG